MKSVQVYWRRRNEILLLVTKEEISEPQKIDLNPLPTELKYAYLEDYEQCLVVISALLSTIQENSLLQVMSAKLIYVLSSFHKIFYAFGIHIHVKLIQFPLNLVL